MNIEFVAAAPEHHSPADELALVDVDPRGVQLFGPDGSCVALAWDELRREANSDGPAAALFRDLLARAESFRRAA